jgi:hypothetical protein
MNKNKDNARPAKARKKLVTAASRAKMSRRRKEWWAHRKAMQAQPHDVLARLVYKSIDLPYPYDDTELASSKIAKTRSTRRRSSKKGTVRPSMLAKIICEVAGLPDPYDDPEPTPEGGAKVKPISTIAPPTDLDE